MLETQSRRVTVSRYERWTVVALPGALDWTTAPSVRADVYDILDGGVRFVLLDMAKVAAMDAVGIGVLLSAYHRMHRTGCDFRIASPPDPVNATLKATGISRIVPIYESMEAAKADLGVREPGG